MDGEEEYDVAIVSDEQAIQKMQTLEKEVKSNINLNNGAAALKLAVESLPPPGKSDAAKKIGADAFLAAILSIPASGADTFLNNSTVQERETVLKYLYKCMSIADKKGCETLLVWHSKIVAKDGHGMINRVLFDKLV